MSLRIQCGVHPSKSPFPNSHAGSIDVGEESSSGGGFSRSGPQDRAAARCAHAYRPTRCAGSSGCCSCHLKLAAANGYPGTPIRGTEIKGLERAAEIEGVEIFHAGTRLEAGRLLADGGRVLNVTARGRTVSEARARAYEAVRRIDWPGGFCRSDIGWRELERERNAT